MSQQKKICMVGAFLLKTSLVARFVKSTYSDIYNRESVKIDKN